MGNIRMAVPEDAAALSEIYAYYVRDTDVSFEATPPGTEEFVRRIGAIWPKYPYLVYEENGGISGYAYAAPYHERVAYRYSVTTSVYLRDGATGRGLGKILYRVLFEILREQGFRNVYAFITMPNPMSVRLHEGFGFRRVGTATRCGYKFGRWIDVATMEMFLIKDGAENDASGVPEPTIAVTEIDPDFLQRTLDCRG